MNINHFDSVLVTFLLRRLSTWGKQPEHTHDMVAHICHPSALDLEARSSGVQSHPLLHSEYKVSLGYRRLPKNNGGEKTEGGGLISEINWPEEGFMAHGFGVQASPVRNQKNKSWGSEHCLRLPGWRKVRIKGESRVGGFMPNFGNNRTTSVLGGRYHNRHISEKLNFCVFVCRTHW